MRRREFIAALGSAAAWPLTAHAQQQTDKVWRVGYLSAASATNNVAVAVLDDFRLKLNELGYVEGRNLDLYVRRANDDYDRLPGLARELVSLAPNVIVGAANIATLALQRATSSIPIVMTASSSDPIGSGLVKSLAKPGGNITGVSNQGVDLTAKTLELLHVAVPNAKRIAVLMSANPGHESIVKEAYLAAGALGITIIPVTARTLDDLGNAFAKMHSESCDALFVAADARINRRIVELANEWRLPAIYQFGDFVDMGGWLSYGPDFHDSWRKAAVYVDRILKGANPADLPVEQPTKFELEINLKTSKLLGLTIPDSILARSDKVIE
jgi:putative tryptophan/tyrosine transport system substrate-binding protein